MSTLYLSDAGTRFAALWPGETEIEWSPPVESIDKTKARAAWQTLAHRRRLKIESVPLSRLEQLAKTRKKILT